jgi:hypothetical protein
MNLKAKVERLEEKAGMKKGTIIVVQMPDESKKEALQKANVLPGSDVTLIKVVFVETNVPRAPNE